MTPATQPDISTADGEVGACWPPNPQPVEQGSASTLPLLLLGRVVYGLGIGTAMHVAPLYIAETSPPDLRGKLVSLKEAAIVGGIVLGFLAGML